MEPPQHLKLGRRRSPARSARAGPPPRPGQPEARRPRLRPNSPNPESAKRAAGPRSRARPVRPSGRPSAPPSAPPLPGPAHIFCRPRPQHRPQLLPCQAPPSAPPTAPPLPGSIHSSAHSFSATRLRPHPPTPHSAPSSASSLFLVALGTAPALATPPPPIYSALRTDPNHCPPQTLP